MQVGRYKKWFIYCMCLMPILFGGCHMKKQVDISSEVSDSNEDIKCEIVKVDNNKGDIEKIAEKFIGIAVEEAVNKGAEYQEDSFYFEHGTTFFSYTGKSLEGLGPIITYRDEYEMAGDQYEMAVDYLRQPTASNVLGWGLRQVLPDENLDNCKKEEILNFCNPYAELLGYNSENSVAEVYALTIDKLNSTDKGSYARVTYGPLTGINNKKILTDDELRDKEKKYPWSKKYEAMYVVYRPYINELLLDSHYCSLEMVYAPAYGKIVYAFGEIPWVVKEKTSADSLISKEDAIAETMLINNITDKNNITVDNVFLVYSMDITHLRKDMGLDLCWRVDFKIENSAQYIDEESYKTILINAVTGEECTMWPGLGD